MQLILSLSFNVDILSLPPVSPGMSAPFSFHCTPGLLPPFVNDECISTSSFWQITLSGATVIAMPDGCTWLTVMEIELLTTAGARHFRLPVIWQDTTSPFDNVLVV